MKQQYYKEAWVETADQSHWPCITILPFMLCRCRTDFGVARFDSTRKPSPPETLEEFDSFQTALEERAPKCRASVTLLFEIRYRGGAGTQSRRMRTGQEEAFDGLSGSDLKGPGQQLGELEEAAD